MATEIREGDLVTFSKPFLDRHEECAWMREVVVGIVEKVHVSVRAGRGQMSGNKRGGTYTRTTYRVTWERPGMQDFTHSYSRGDLKTAR